MSAQRISVFIVLFMVAASMNAGTVCAQSDCKSECDTCEVGRRAGSQYCPEDPWTRGRIWLKQTGHFGWFYNCDCEENKRKSPYICWKKSNSPFSGERLFECIRCDIKNIKQRIADGSKECCGNRIRKTPCRSDHCQN